MEHTPERRMHALIRQSIIVYIKPEMYSASELLALKMSAVLASSGLVPIDVWNEQCLIQALNAAGLKSHAELFSGSPAFNALESTEGVSPGVELVRAQFKTAETLRELATTQFRWMMSWFSSPPPTRRVDTK